MTVAFDFIAALVGLRPSRRRDKIETPRVQKTPAEIHLKSAGSCPNNRSHLSMQCRWPLKTLGSTICIRHQFLKSLFAGTKV